jgi:hypothetical protein
MPGSAVRWIVLAVGLGVLAGCANVSGKDLPMVSNSDPTWALVPDHLEFGALPK